MAGSRGITSFGESSRHSAGEGKQARARWRKDRVSGNEGDGFRGVVERLVARGAAGHCAFGAGPSLPDRWRM